MGLFTFQNGEVNCGEWDSKILKNPYPESSNHVLNVVKVHLCLLYADIPTFLHKRQCLIYLLISCQAARDAAEKAKSLPSADEQVDNAITSAKLSAAVARLVAENAVKHQKMCSIFWRAFG